MALKNEKRPERKVRLAQVSDIQILSHHLKRFVLSGTDFEDFPQGQEGAHVKVLFPHPGEALPNLDIKSQNSAVKRSYTIREFNSETKELVLDFVVNRHNGPATNWASQAKLGDYIGIAGPGLRKLTNFEANSYLLVGDITAVNAVNGYTKFIPKQATLKALVTVPTRNDIIDMDTYENLQLVWRVEDEDPLDIAQSVKVLAADMNKDSQVFIGLEARALRSVKSMLLSELAFNRLHIHATGYWKKGLDADRFGADKRRNPL